MFPHVRIWLVVVSVVVFTSLPGLGLGGCAQHTGSIEGAWKTKTGGQGPQDPTWFEFYPDRTGEFYGVSKPPTHYIWTRINDPAELEDFIADTGMSLRNSVREGASLPYVADGQYLLLVDAKASKGFPPMKIISLRQASMVIELDGDGTRQVLTLERVE